MRSDAANYANLLGRSDSFNPYYDAALCSIDPGQRGRASSYWLVADIGVRPMSIRSGMSKTEVAALRRDVRFAPDQQTSSGCLGMSEKCQQEALQDVIVGQ